MKRRSFLALGAAAAAAPLLPPLPAAGADTTVTEALMGLSQAAGPCMGDVFLTDEAVWVLRSEWKRFVITKTVYPIAFEDGDWLYDSTEEDDA